MDSQSQFDFFFSKMVRQDPKFNSDSQLHSAFFSESHCRLQTFAGNFYKIRFLETSSEESSDNEKEIRRPGERGKSAVKEIPDDDSDDANSPIEG